MALADAVLVVADAMDLSAASCEKVYGLLLKSYADQLRVALKASEGQSTSSPMTGLLLGDSGEAFNRQRIEEARQQVRRERDTADESERMLEVRGGPADESVFAAPASMPVGAYTMIAGVRYQLKDGVLQYSPVQAANGQTVCVSET